MLVARQQTQIYDRDVRDVLIYAGLNDCRISMMVVAFLGTLQPVDGYILLEIATMANLRCFLVAINIFEICFIGRSFRYFAVELEANRWLHFAQICSGSKPTLLFGCYIHL